MKNKLIEILQAMGRVAFTNDEKADYLLANDVVPVVRCKNCRYSRNMPLGMCYLHTEPCSNAKGYKGEAVCVEPDDFCSYGERGNEK